MFVKPMPGQQIPDPQQFGTPGHFLPAEGREVDESAYWHRRVRDGDVIVIAPTEEPSDE